MTDIRVRCVVLLCGTLACTTLASAACFNITDPFPVGGGLKQIDIDGVPPSLAVGDSVRLGAIGMVTGLAGLFTYDPLRDAVWTVSDTSVAQITPIIPNPADSVVAAGAWVRGKRAGSTEVTVSARKVSSTVTIHVVQQ